jgi:RNA polymerase sigma factor (sigma-70 family)
VFSSTKKSQNREKLSHFLGKFLIIHRKKYIIGLIFSFTKMDTSTEKIDAIERVINDFSSLIRSAIRKTSPSVDQFQMDDIEQEVKIKIWKEITKSEKKILNLGSYIWKVTYTTTCRIMKTLSSERKITWSQTDGLQNIDEKIASEKAASPNNHLENKELMEIVRESVDSLIESRRAVLKLYLIGMDQPEITEYFGWSEGKVRNLLSRGLGDLRKALQERGI